MKKEIRTKETCGADESTPSHSEYFTWLNNTNEGSNEEQTLANLDFFAYLQKTYGMQLDIYAWDAGNLDGANKTYADFSKGKLKAQYPNGYAPIVDAAAKIGTRMGVWGGTDGYGDTPEEEQKRRDLLVGLCRDYHFALFKFDRVCGKLKKKNRPAFAKTIRECRTYSPDLVLLLHRNKVGKEWIYATTDLWQWKETYVGGNSYNLITAPHHRAFAFIRGLTPNLTRLMEDHGVCICSFNDYFEDDMIIQAFGRCLILAPEIYGNPFFLRDDEYPILARIFNLHRRYRDILVNGMQLPKKYGTFAVSRGDGDRRFLCTSNPTWEKKDITVSLSEEIGLQKGDSFSLIKRFPYEGLVGVYGWGEEVTLTLPPFRACLLEIVKTEKADGVLTGCEYLTLHETDGTPDTVKIVYAYDDICMQKGFTRSKIAESEKTDGREVAPLYLGSMKKTRIPKNDRQLYETAMFAVSNDSFETASRIRAGETAIPQVKKARDLFFEQETYRYRGTESSVLFDGKEDTYFDTRMLPYIFNLRIAGGDLRVDFGKEFYCDTVEIVYFDPKENVQNQTPKQRYSKKGEYSADLDVWKKAKKFDELIYEEHFTTKLVVERVNNVIDLEGSKKKAVFTIGDTLRYFSLPNPMSRVFSVVAYVDGKAVEPNNPTANNLMAPYRRKKTKLCQKVTVSVPQQSDNTFLSVAVNGFFGYEGVYCVAECNGKYYGMTDRAPEFPVNTWQHEAMKTPSNNTYYMPVYEEMKGRAVTVYALFNRLFTHIRSIDVYLCPKHLELSGTILTI